MIAPRFDFAYEFGPGGVAIPPQFAGAMGFCHGRATVHDGSSEWEIDRTGKPLGAKRPHVEAADPCAED